jgi:hypothetical protein
MQLALEEKYITYYPPKSQLLKWVGNKQKFAVEITRYFPTDINRYIEPFLGSGAILATVAPNNGWGSDVFKPLIEIWQKLAYDPNALIDWYAERRNRLEAQVKEETFIKVCWPLTTRSQTGLIFCTLPGLATAVSYDSGRRMVICLPPAAFTRRFRSRALLRG